MKWSLDIGIASLAKKNEELCGDVVEIKKGPDSTVVVLSDGLGSGVKANILATMTAKIAGNLLAKGVGLTEVVDTITDTLPVCQVRQLAYSTFTIMQISEQGETVITRYDNPPALLIRNMEEIPLLGREKYIRHCKIYENQITLEEGDLLFMVSDGVTHAGIGALLPLGLGEEGLVKLIKTKINTSRDSQHIAEEILEYCQAYSAMEPGDDITVVAIKKRRPVQGVVLSGPPLSKNDDARVTEDFFSGAKRRVICGGTTANIVAREKGLKLEVSDSYEDYTLPPIAYMEGVDLVTEGILTLTRALELLETGWPESRHLNNGARRLLRWFMECDEIELLVGLAVNPAHLSSDMPFELGLRPSVLQRLRELLQARGKKITIKWF